MEWRSLMMMKKIASALMVGLLMSGSCMHAGAGGYEANAPMPHSSCSSGEEQGAQKQQAYPQFSAPHAKIKTTRSSRQNGPTSLLMDTSRALGRLSKPLVTGLTAVSAALAGFVFMCMGKSQSHDDESSHR